MSKAPEEAVRRKTRRVRLEQPELLAVADIDDVMTKLDGRQQAFVVAWFVAKYDTIREC